MVFVLELDSTPCLLDEGSVLIVWKKLVLDDSPADVPGGRVLAVLCSCFVLWPFGRLLVVGFLGSGDCAFASVRSGEVYSWLVSDG